MLVLINLEKYWEDNTVVRNLGIYIYWHIFFSSVTEALREYSQVLISILIMLYFALKK